MKPFVVRPIQRLKGEISLLGDKSISHRAIILSALSSARTIINNFPLNKDCLSTVEAFKKLGIKITQRRQGYISVVTVSGKGLNGLKNSKRAIFVGDSGTTLRLILGVLAGQKFQTKLTAGKSLSQRPMLRVTKPLRLMGAQIKAKVKRQNLPAERLPAGRAGQEAKVEEYPPIVIKGSVLKPINYKMPVASAQVKSAILLAGLFAKGKTRIVEPVPTRDHTERMLKLFKADIKVTGNTIVIKGDKKLVSPRAITIPGDISSAAFLMVLSAIIPNSRLLIKNVSLNPTRIGIIKVLKRMGAKINIKYPACPAGRQISNIKIGEPLGDLLVKSSVLKGVIVRKKEISSLIDELPILMVAACYAKGKTVFEGVEELRVKETDRIRSVSENLKRMSGKIRVFKKGGREKIIIHGVAQLKGARLKSFGDHRTAISMVVAGLGAVGKSSIDDITCINKSFPNFLGQLNSLIP